MGRSSFQPGPAREIFIVDDDSSVCDALKLLLGVEGFGCRVFRDAESFLEALDHENPLCVVMDVQMPGYSGLEVLRILKARHFEAPVFMMSGRSDIAMAVEAMKTGAYDFIEKPFAAGMMIERIRAAVAAQTARDCGRVDGIPQFAEARLLTARERDVLSLIAKGASNKEAGRRLGISPRTIEVHRARIMDKLGAKNAADLMRIVLMNAGPKTRGQSAPEDMVAAD
ncbi:LuxR family transcriptional regulator [Afipia sp. P52-10]|nr:LuxR family transcriptional regulator [Afipia sp. P52-10]